VEHRFLNDLNELEGCVKTSKKLERLRKDIFKTANYKKKPIIKDAS